MNIRIPKYTADAAPGTADLNFDLCTQNTASGGTVADLGAGSGALSRRLRDYGFRVHAVDLEPMKAHDFEGIERHQANLEEGIPLRSESCDATICQEAAHQLENPWLLFREAARILKPEGVFVMSTPNMNHLFVRLFELATHKTPHFLDSHYQLAHQMTPLPMWTLKRMGEKAGLSLFETNYNMNYLPVVRLRLPGRTRRFGHTLVTAWRKLASSPSSVISASPTPSPEAQDGSENLLRRNA